MADKPLKATCHCGDITVTVPRLPDYINECQCTICRRYAAAWTYYKIAEVTIDKKPGAEVLQYIWGDKERSFNFCKKCGCMCYHWPVEEDITSDEQAGRTGVNTRMMDPMELLFVDRRIENAWLLAPLNNPAMAHEQDKAKY